MSLLARDLSFAYGKQPVVQGVSFELQPGEVLGLVGPNGAGKSTIIRLLTKVLPAAAGTVTVDGLDSRRLSRLSLARALAVVPQGGELPNAFTTLELVMMGRTPHLGFLAQEGPEDVAKVESVMRRTDTWRYRDRPVSELSGGERQRVLLARALAQEPRYLLLDEPTSHLDLKYQAEVLALTRLEVRRGVGALVVMHDLNLAARSCDRLLVLEAGSCVAAGPPQEVLSEDLIMAVYGVGAEVFMQPGTDLPVVIPRL